MPMQYAKIFKLVKMKIFSRNCLIFSIFAQNIDCGYMLEPPHHHRLDKAVLASTHNLCFGSKIKKIDNTPEYPNFTV